MKKQYAVYFTNECECGLFDDRFYNSVDALIDVKRLRKGDLSKTEYKIVKVICEDV
jgi:hypothetical protein